MYGRKNCSRYIKTNQKIRFRLKAKNGEIYVLVRLTLLRVMHKRCKISNIKFQKENPLKF